MIKRLFLHDRLFSILILIQFTSIFLIMFYGLDLYYQFSSIKDNIDKIRYAEEYDYSLAFDTQLFDEKGRVAFGKGNIIYRTFFPMGDSVLNQDNVDILWEQSEPVLEQINYIQGYSLSDDITTPSCILGNKWKKIVESGKNGQYIDILGIEFNVVGYFEPLMIDDSDERCLIIGDSLTDNELKKIANFNDGQFIYKSAVFSGIEASFKNWILNYSLEENVNLMMNRDMVMDSNIIATQIYEGYAKKIFAVLAVFSMINTFYLSYVWGKKKQKSLMVKKVFGYSNRLLVKDILGEIAVLEVLSFGLACLVTFIYEIAFRSLTEWLSIILKGMPIVVIVIIVFTAIYLVSQMFWVVKAQPVEILRNNE